MMSQPRDGEGLAASRRVLYQVALSRSPLASVAPPVAARSRVAGSGEKSGSACPSFCPVVFLLNLVDELAHQVQHAVPRPGLLPQVRSRISGLSGRDGRIAGATELPLVEGQEIGLRPCQLSSHIDQIRVNGEMGQAAPVGEQRLSWVPVRPVLANGVFHRLHR